MAHEWKMPVNLKIMVLSAFFIVTRADSSVKIYHREELLEEPTKPYSYQYAVNDDHSGANFAASQTADGQTVRGSYSVHLPDGRIQTVTYTADKYNGYVADV